MDFCPGNSCIQKKILIHCCPQMLRTAKTNMSLYICCVLLHIMTSSSYQFIDFGPSYVYLSIFFNEQYQNYRVLFTTFMNSDF